MGLLSVADALLDKPMNEVLLQLPVSQEVKAALSGGQNRFRDVYEVLLAMERAEWNELGARAARLGEIEEKLPDTYKLAIQRAAALTF
jgi:EAL and modified HD-GYP domain-containing signal transduction protein